MLLFLATLPWLLLVLSLLFLVRRRPRLQDYPPARVEAPPSAGSAAPRVSIIVPTCNDATRVGMCLATLLDAEYTDYEILVVDAESGDGTREIVEALRQRTPDRIRLVRTGELPGGRPWRAVACARGAEEATGELLLFTEPGTIHGSELLARAVTVLDREEADLLTVQPRLNMRGFWERLIMPHVRLVLRARFPSARLVNRSRSPRNAVAHHEFLLFRRDAYEAIGGHGVMTYGEVEDLAIAQAVVRAGRCLFLVHGDAFLETRVLRSFGDFASDWTAAFPPASRTTVAPWAGVFAPWIVAATPLVLFFLPPAVLVAGWVTGGVVAVTWGLWASLLSLLFWLVIYAVHRIRPAYALVYPAGALITSILFVRSILQTRG